MPSLVAGDIFEAVFRYAYATDPSGVYVNRLHWKVVDAGPGGEVDEFNLADGLSKTWGLLVRDVMHPAVRYESCTVQSFPGGLRTNGSFSVEGAGNGTANFGNVLPAQNAYCLRKRTAVAGRAYRGRVFIPSIPEPKQTKGMLDAGWMTGVEWTAFRNSFKTDVGLFAPATDVTVRMWVASTAAGGTPVFRTPVTDLVSDMVIRAQRRRQNLKGS